MPPDDYAYLAALWPRWTQGQWGEEVLLRLRQADDSVQWLQLTSHYKPSLHGPGQVSGIHVVSADFRPRIHPA